MWMIVDEKRLGVDQFLAVNVNGRSSDHAGYGRRSGAVWNWPMELMSYRQPECRE
jgi:hypothetical protein